MKTRLGVAIAAFPALAACSQTPVEDADDAVFTNGAICPVNEAQQWAEALAYADNSLVLLGSNDNETRTYPGRRLRLEGERHDLDLRGASVRKHRRYRQSTLGRTHRPRPAASIGRSERHGAIAAQQLIKIYS